MHEPVLLQELIEGLNLQAGETLVDLTVNRGGHSRALCVALGKEGKVVGVDLDGQALSEARANLATCPGTVTLLEGNFRNLEQLLDQAGVTQVNAILADLGVSSQQLDTPERGFSFQATGPLSMTLAANPDTSGVTASQVVNEWQEETLADIIYAYGEERFARRIAKAIVEAREAHPITTTAELSEVIRSAVPSWYQHQRRHYATKTFQALRIAVNDELGALKAMLPQAWSRLAPGGRLALISFHSLEARIVKDFYRDLVKQGVGGLVTKKSVRPTREESLRNPRSRSAQLRIIKKL